MQSYYVKFDQALARIDLVPATAAKMNWAYRENDFFDVINNLERDIAYVTGYVGTGLWHQHLQDAAYERRLLAVTTYGKVWSVQKPYGGETNAIEDEWLASVRDLVNTGCTGWTWGEGHICADRWIAVDRERSRRWDGVCESFNKQIAPLVVELATRLQALAQRLKELHGRLVEDFGRTVSQFEQKRWFESRYLRACGAASEGVPNHGNHWRQRGS